MPDNSKITLKQLKDAMNMVKAYIDEQIQGISPNPPEVPCTGIVLNKGTLSFTTNATQTLVATVTPTNCTDTVTWSVSPARIVTVNNGVVTPVGNGSCTITATCGSYSATCAITVSGIAVSPVLYELAEAKTFNGTSDYVDTGVALLTGDNLNKDWTMLIDFTPTKLAQASIMHCMTEESPWPGMYLSLTATGGVQMVFPNGSTKNNIITVTANQRIKLVIKKIGTTFTVYNSSMSSLHTNNPGSITTTNNSVILGAIQVHNNGQRTTSYDRFFKGTIHRFKIAEGNMSSSECLNWMA